MRVSPTFSWCSRNETLSHTLTQSPATSAICSCFPSRLFSAWCYCSIQWYTCRTSFLPLLLLERARDCSPAVVWPNWQCCGDPGCLEQSTGFYLEACVLILKLEPCSQRQAKGEDEASRERHLRGIRPPEHGQTCPVFTHPYQKHCRSLHAVKQPLLFLLELSHLYDY